MDCYICHRAHDPERVPFYCAVDARNRLYPGRLANATILTESEELSEQVDKLLAASDVTGDASPTDRTTLFYLENLRSEEAKVRKRTENIKRAVAKLREQNEAKRRANEEKKADLARRRAALAAARSSPFAPRARTLEDVKKSNRMTKYSWGREYEATVQYRAALCLEVAKVYRLTRIPRRGPSRYEYKVGGLDIIDLHQMNSADPELLSASLGYITHLLSLAAYYLSIQLPAEITLPHKDYPRPTIFSLASSYRHEDIRFPGTANASPDGRDQHFTDIPKPRPLSVDKSLPSLAKDDPSAYKNFLEGVCLLAYDIVWLCRTQGVSVGDSFDDFAALGRNMYSLLVVATQQSQSTGPVVGDTGRNDEAHEASTGQLTRTAPRVGFYSHGSSYMPLTGTAGNELARVMKMINPVKYADTLRSKLGQENPAREWELVEEIDIPAPDDGMMGETVLVGRSKKDSDGHSQHQPTSRFGMESYMSVSTARGGGGSTAGDVTSRMSQLSLNRGSGTPAPRDREKGTSGWTKIKPRQGGS